MRLRRVLALMLVAVGAMAMTPSVALASRAEVAGDENQRLVPDNYLEAKQYHINEARVAGLVSARQSVTAWQVTQGSWNGEALDGLSLVLVETRLEDGQSAATTHCYVSHLATPAQRTALLAAYVSSHGSAQGLDLTAWRVEAAVIKLEIAGHTVVLHLGTIA